MWACLAATLPIVSRITRLPDSYPSQCLDYFDGTEPHGTAVAEAVTDVAPDATLYIAIPYSDGDIREIADWMIGEGVSVINMSLGVTFDGPGDGTSPSSVSPLNAVDRAVNGGITWVNSARAGNAAEDTWFGSYMDPDNNGILAFNALNDESMNILYLECRPFRVQLRWEDTWGGADTDLDVGLYDHTAGEFLGVGSADLQTGASGHNPYETFAHRPLSTRNDISIVVIHRSGPVPEWIQLTIWGWTLIEHHTGSGSITNPAESAKPRSAGRGGRSLLQHSRG